MQKITFLFMLFALSFSIKAQTYFSEDFEVGSLPDGWEIVTNSSDGGYSFGMALPLSSQYWTIPSNESIIAVSNDDKCNCDKSNDQLISSSFSLANAENAFLSFDYVFMQYGMEHLNVSFSTDGGSNWSVFNQVSQTTIPGTDGEWGKYTIFMGDVIGEDDVKLSFKYNDGSDWGYGLALDNIEVYKPEDKTDVALVSLDIPKNYRIGEAVTIAGVIENLGTDTLESVTVSWFDGTNTFSQEFTGLSIVPFGKYAFKHANKFVPTTEGSVELKVTVSKPNGAVDDDNSNNVLTRYLVIWTDFVERTVLIEEFSTEQCPNCPPVATYLDQIAGSNENVIMMVHHAGYGTDKFTIPENEELLTFYNAGGSVYAPAGMIDRHYNGLDNDENEGPDPGPVFWPGDPFGARKVNERLDEVSMVEVNIDGSINMETQTIDITVSGSFMEDYNADLGVSLWILEDGVKSTGQAGFSGEWTHHSIVRDAISATFGDAITTETTSGDSYTVSYAYNFDAKWQQQNMSLIAMVNSLNEGDVNKREVHNASVLNIKELSGYEEKCYITLELDMLNVDGFDALVDQVFVEGTFSDNKIEMTSEDDRYYTAVVLVDLNTSYTYDYSTTQLTQDLDRTVSVVDKNIKVSDVYKTGNAVFSKLNNVEVYPNPFNNLIRLVGLNDVENVVLRNLLGQVVKQIDVSGETMHFETTELENGVYTLTLYGKAGNKRNIKLIKQ